MHEVEARAARTDTTERDARDRGGAARSVDGDSMDAVIESWEWQRTPVGEPAGWPDLLRSMVRLALDSRFAM